MFDENFEVTVKLETSVGHKFKISEVEREGCYLNIFHKGEKAHREFYLNKEDLILLTVLLEKTRESMPENE